MAQRGLLPPHLCKALREEFCRLPGLRGVLQEQATSSRATPRLKRVTGAGRSCWAQGRWGTLAGAGTATQGQRGGHCRTQGTCPSQDDKDLVGLLHSLATTLRSFCRMHISRLCPNQAGETPACCLPGICDGDEGAWAGSLWVPPLPAPKN